MKPLSPKSLEKKYAELGLSKAKTDLLHNYFLCFANLYGILEVREAWDIFKYYEGNKIRKKDFITFSGIVQREPDLPYTILELNEVYTGEPAGMSDMRLIVNNDLIGLGYGKFARIYHLVDLAADMELYIPALTAPVVFAVNAVGDALTVSVVQSFEDDALVRVFCQVCTENGLKINSNDMGTEVLDTLEKDAVRLI